MRIRGRIGFWFDVEVEDARDLDAAWAKVYGDILGRVHREHHDQLVGREHDPETAPFLYGLAFRLPANYVITGYDARRGYDDEDDGQVEPNARPTLQLILGGQDGTEPSPRGPGGPGAQSSDS